MRTIVFAIFALCLLASTACAGNFDSVVNNNGPCKIIPAETQVKITNMAHDLRVFELVRENHVQAEGIIKVISTEIEE